MNTTSLRGSKLSGVYIRGNTLTVSIPSKSGVSFLKNLKSFILLLVLPTEMGGRCRDTPLIPPPPHYDMFSMIMGSSQCGQSFKTKRLFIWKLHLSTCGLSILDSFLNPSRHSTSPYIS